MVSSVIKPALGVLRQLLWYSLILIVAGIAANAWLTRHQASGELPVLPVKNVDNPVVEQRVINAGDSDSQLWALQNRPQLIYFFADWCPVCRLQNPVISGLDQSYPVLGVAMQSGDEQSLKQYAEQHKLDFTIINDRDGSISRSFGVDGVPAVFILDRDGNIHSSTRGYSTGAGLRARIWLADET